MKITITSVSLPYFAPFEKYSQIVGQFPVAGKTLEEIQIERLTKFFSGTSFEEVILRADFWPSEDILRQTASGVISELYDNQNVLLMSTKPDTKNSARIDNKSFIIKYPWHMLKINEELIASITKPAILGTVRASSNIDGTIILGEESVILPGVYIEGNAIIGKKCKIGPNCYIRGNTFIGDGCHIGQAVEIKNCLIMNKVSIGHLSYVGDSIIASNTNFGAGTITANLRHDGKNHRTMIQGELIDTGRRKFGVLAGEGAHTGINTTIYPGRKIYSNASTLPGEIVNKDKLQ